MSKYTVYGVLHIPVFTVIEAENEKQALDIAHTRETIESCADVCSHSEDNHLEMWCLQDDTNGDVDVDDESLEIDET